MPGGSDRDYQAEYRKNNPQYVAEQRMRERAKGKAFRRLAAAHPAEYNRLLAQELQREKEKARVQQSDQQQQ